MPKKFWYRIAFIVCSSFHFRNLLKDLMFPFHSYQPMGLEELLSDKDSEDELDEDLATVEDRRV